MKNQKTYLRGKIGALFTVIFFVFIGQVGADEIVYKYQKMLLEKVNKPVIEDIKFENNAWAEAKKITEKYIGPANVEKPVTLVIKNCRFLDSSRGLRGVYDADLNIVLATDYKVLVHEYLHAIFYLTGNKSFAGDESFIRALEPTL